MDFILPALPAAASLLLGFALGFLLRGRRCTEAESKAAKPWYPAIVERAGEGILIVDAASGRILDANPALLRKLGYAAEELAALNVADVLSENSSAEPTSGAATTLARTTREVTQRARDGSLIPVDLSASMLDVDGCRAVCYVLRDATHRKQREDTLRQKESQAEQRADYLAHRDALTGLVNRRAFKLELREMVMDIEHAGPLALLVLDIDDFSSLNDTLGAEVGDAVLKEVAARLQRVIGERGRVARAGNDEFAVTLQPAANSDAAAKLALEAQNALALPMDCLGHSLRIRATVGISLCPPDAPDVDALLSHADLALSQAKADEPGSVQFFSVQMDAQARRRLDLVHSLKHALESDELTVHYQPVLDIATRQVLGLEALVRWQHPRLGLIPPGDFVPLAEQSGLIVQLGERVLRMVCEQVVAWRDEGLPIVPVAVNVSPQQFQRGSVAALVQTVLRETGMKAQYLAIEITEGSLMSEAGRYAGELEVLRAAGVRILVDDFGTGYSSLSYLRRLPLDTLKIDRSFVAHVATNAADEAIVSAILALARSLGLKVVAEGVESQEQLAVLGRHGCQMAQGYYFSPPMPAERCVGMLRELAVRTSFSDTMRIQFNNVGGKRRLSLVR